MISLAALGDDWQRFQSAALSHAVPVQPALYISYGPPGSGKSRVIEYVAQTDACLQAHGYVPVIVDDIIAALPEYKAARAQATTAAERQRVYFQYRRVADQLSDALLNDALAQHLNVVWESTGRNRAWLVRELERWKRLGYRTVILYPLVPYEQLLERVLARERLTDQEAAPAQQIEQTYRAAQRNAIALLRSNHLDELMLFDNSGAPGSISRVLRARKRYVYTGESGLAPAYASDVPVQFEAPGVLLELECNSGGGGGGTCMRVESTLQALEPTLAQFIREACSTPCGWQTL